jgi:hypothetical protein
MPNVRVVIERAVVLMVAASSTGIAQQASRETGSIVGFVTAQITGASIGFADVAIEQPRIAMFASAAGVFRVRDLRPGAMTIRVRRIGFRPATVNVTIIRGSEDRYASYWRQLRWS